MKGSKELNKQFIFLQSACTTDGRREQLDRINITDHSMITTNGFKLHAIETPETVEERGCYMVNNGKVRTSDQFINAHDPTDKPFPEFGRVLPTTPTPCNVAVNAKSLSDTLKHFDEGVIIKIRERTDPIEIFGTVQGQKAYAIVMPMYIEPDSYIYRPE